MQSLLTARDVARLASVPRRRVYHCARIGVLPSVRIGRLRRFRAADVDAWLAKDARRSARRLRRFRSAGAHAPPPALQSTRGEREQ